MIYLTRNKILPAEVSSVGLIRQSGLCESPLAAMTAAYPSLLLFCSGATEDRDGRKTQRFETKFTAATAPTKKGGERGSVARWQNLIPSFPWIGPGWRAWGTIQGKEGIKFCSTA